MIDQTPKLPSPHFGEAGIKKGVAAGCLTVSVSLSGNAAGKTSEQLPARIRELDGEEACLHA